MSSKLSLVSVAIPVPLRRNFTYTIEGEALALGTRVAVPFHGRKMAGFVVGHPTEAPEGVRLKKVAGMLSTGPVFSEELLSFLIEAARYYFHPAGEVLRAAAPALPKNAIRNLQKSGFLESTETIKGKAIGEKKRILYVRLKKDSPTGRLGARQQAVVAFLQERPEMISIDELRDVIKDARTVVRGLEKRGVLESEERDADPFFGISVPKDTPPTLTDAQRHATETMLAALATNDSSSAASSFLLHGVTGSGKTEVYLRVIAACRDLNRGALLLVPEIALTPQLVSRFRARFGDDIAVLHSGLTDREREDAWQRLRNGETRIALGARSALFAPVEDLGVIVVDEEHDPSFKQEDGFRYHAKDMALFRAHRAGALCILGSATPSVESYHRALAGKMTLLSLPERATKQQLPKVSIVDLRKNARGPSGHSFISGELDAAIKSCLSKQEQAILFLNRRGFAPCMTCMSCGEVVGCPTCSVSLTEHKSARALRCHYCDYSRSIPKHCPECKAEAMTSRGAGTEQIEEILKEVYPTARVARLDRDVSSGRGVEKVLGQMRRHEKDILVGTQMVTKGHDVPRVTLVGVLNADQSLGFPDFRAQERTFQLLAQVAGRAGRGESKGRVIFQTYQPEHPSIRQAAQHNYEAFYHDELPTRQELRYSPFSRLIAVRVDAGAEHIAQRTARMLADLAKAHSAVRTGEVILVGPAASPIARVRGRYRFRFLLRSDQTTLLRSVGAQLAARIEHGIAPARGSVDVDPVSML